VAFAEDMSVFFDVDEFAVAATFTTSGGAQVSASVIFDMPTEEILGGDMLSDEYAMTYQAGELSAVKAGDYGFIGGNRYRIRSIKMIHDGALKEAKLTKA